jgi:hypothetical protein
LQERDAEPQQGQQRQSWAARIWHHDASKQQQQKSMQFQQPPPQQQQQQQQLEVSEYSQPLRRLQQDLPPSVPIEDSCYTTRCQRPWLNVTANVTINSFTGAPYIWDICWPLCEYQ